MTVSLAIGLSLGLQSVRQIAVLLMMLHGGIAM
jgi:hypothetical protein